MVFRDIHFEFLSGMIGAYRGVPVTDRLTLDPLSRKNSDAVTGVSLAQEESDAQMVAAMARESRVLGFMVVWFL